MAHESQGPPATITPPSPEPARLLPTDANRGWLTHAKHSMVAGDGRPAWRSLLLSIVHLATMGSLGLMGIMVVLVLIFIGMATLPFAGLGVFFLMGAVYAVFTLAFIEGERLRALNGLEVPPLRRVKGEGEGVGPFARMVLRQLTDAAMWRLFASFAISAIVGFIMLLLVNLGAQSVFTAFAWLRGGEISYAIFGYRPAWGTSILSVLGLIVSGAGIIAAALLQSAVGRTFGILPSRDTLNRQVQERQAQRAGAVRAADVERTRIERDLHDGVQPRLVSVAISLGMAEKKIDSDPQAAKTLVTEAHSSIKAAITELRQLARGIHPSVLDDRGLDAALSALAAQSHIPVVMDVRMDEREELAQDPTFAAGLRDAEAAVYFAIAESLTNAAKHSRASECRVIGRLRGLPDHPALWARVEDNGVGGAVVIPGGGIDGISNRILAAGGELSFVSPHGGPTALEVSVPCAS